MPLTEAFQCIDHHHNMLKRLQLIPPTFRGNQVRKNMAFIHLQQIINPGKLKFKFNHLLL